MASSDPVGVVLLQLGTPDEPTTPALRRYLEQFLRDRRVIDLPRALWLPLLYLRILRTRPAQSAALYRRIWTPAGSPLAATTSRQAALLAERLNRSGSPAVQVVVGMRYGNPSIASAVDALAAAGSERILAFPMYPQYASATTGSSLEELTRVIAARRVVPAVRIVPPYYEDPAYVGALAAVARECLGTWTPDHTVISFHGMPKRYAASGDPYPQHCEATARTLVEAMRWQAGRTTLAYQSLFGREEWLRPYSNETLKALAARHLDRLAVICPGFTADCLETLEEMGMTNRELYEREGGGEYRLIPCLNDHVAWIDAMETIARRELQGWM
jgi:ferrochelatase